MHQLITSHIDIKSKVLPSDLFIYNSKCVNYYFDETNFPTLRGKKSILVE